MATPVSPENVTYDPAVYDPQGQTTTPGRYLTIDSGALVVYVNPAGYHDVQPAGYFELYEGDPAQYEPVVLSTT